jgi:hypothetical protein
MAGVRWVKSRESGSSRGKHVSANPYSTAPMDDVLCCELKFSKSKQNALSPFQQSVQQSRHGNAWTA